MKPPSLKEVQDQMLPTETRPHKNRGTIGNYRQGRNGAKTRQSLEAIIAPNSRAWH